MPETDGPSLCAATAMIVVGLLILIPSGLCTGIGVISILTNALGPGGLGDVEMILFIGGPFVLVGGLLVWLGIRLRNRRPPKGDPGAF